MCLGILISIMCFVTLTVIASLSGSATETHEQRINETDKEFSVEEFVIPPVIEAIFGSWLSPFVLFYLSYFYIVNHLLLLVIILGLKNLGDLFIKEMTILNKFGYQRGNIDKGVILYKKLKQATDFCCRQFSNFLLASHISYVTFFVNAPYVFIGNDDQNSTMKIFIVYFATSGTVWFLAAEFHHSVQNCLKMWANQAFKSEQLTVKERIKLIGICNEILGANGNTGIAVQNKYCAVTYANIGSVRQCIYNPTTVMNFMSSLN